MPTKRRTVQTRHRPKRNRPGGSDRSLPPASKRKGKTQRRELIFSCCSFKLPATKAAETAAVIEIQKQKISDGSLLNILLSEFAATEKAINNLLNAIEQGIFTSSTKERLERLDEQKIELANKIALEKSKTKLLISREEIIRYLQAAIKKKSQQLIDCLVNKVILYNDKIEIYYNYTDNKKPDGNEDRRTFIFYECEKSYLLEHTKLRCPPITLTYKITLYI